MFVKLYVSKLYVGDVDAGHRRRRQSHELINAEMVTHSHTSACKLNARSRS